MSAEERELWLAFRKSKDIRARDALIAMHRPWTYAVVGAVLRERGYPSDIDVADLRQEGLKVIVGSMDRFDPDAGFSFRSFVRKRIRGAALDLISASSELHAQTEWRRQVMSERVQSLKRSKSQGSSIGQIAELAVGVAIGVMLEDTGMFETEAPSDIRDPYAESVDLGHLARKINHLADRMKDPDRMTIFSHYRDGKLFAEIAGTLGVTPARVAQIHARAIQSIRSGLKAAGFDATY